jgi:hypothetical protein
MATTVLYDVIELSTKYSPPLTHIMHINIEFNAAGEAERIMTKLRTFFDLSSVYLGDEDVGFFRLDCDCYVFPAYLRKEKLNELKNLFDTSKIKDGYIHIYKYQESIRLHPLEFRPQEPENEEVNEIIKSLKKSKSSKKKSRKQAS